MFLKKKHANLVIVSVLGGVREIRTPEPLLTVTRFPGVPLQPLEHHSKMFVLLLWVQR